MSDKDRLSCGPTGPASIIKSMARRHQPSFDGFYANQTGINDLLVLDFPVELNIKLEKLNLRLFGDYAYNLDGSSRANAAYNAAHSSYFSGGTTGPSAGYN